MGETARGISQRVSEHRRCVFDYAFGKIYGCKKLSEHFNNGKCCGSEFSVRILEKLEGNGQTERNALDPTTTQIRRARESHWMLKMRTVFPFGLNEKVGSEYNAYLPFVIKL